MKRQTIRQNYNEYHYNAGEYIKYLLQSCILCGAADYLFYKNWWCMLSVFPVAFLFLKWKRKQYIRDRKRILNYQFRDALNSISVAVQAGYSAENAVSACAEDMERLYPPDADIVREFRYMDGQRRISVPVEELFPNLGERTGIEDIENFASVFSAAKRSGGDMDKVIQTSARMIGDRIDVKKEIEATLAAKKTEQMIMSLMPAGIILYLQLTSPGFLQVLYGNAFGVCAMTACLGIYILSYWLGKKIVDIEV